MSLLYWFSCYCTEYNCSRNAARALIKKVTTINEKKGIVFKPATNENDIIIDDADTVQDESELAEVLKINTKQQHETQDTDMATIQSSQSHKHPHSPDIKTQEYNNNTIITDSNKRQKHEEIKEEKTNGKKEQKHKKGKAPYV